MKTAPIRRDVEVISVTPVTISELDIQNELKGISSKPINIARLVILLILLEANLSTGGQRW
jgi:hypothetical protein